MILDLEFQAENPLYQFRWVILSLLFLFTILKNKPKKVPTLRVVRSLAFLCLVSVSNVTAQNVKLHNLIVQPSTYIFQSNDFVRKIDVSKVHSLKVLFVPQNQNITKVYDLKLRKPLLTFHFKKGQFGKFRILFSQGEELIEYRFNYENDNFSMKDIETVN